MRRLVLASFIVPFSILGVGCAADGAFDGAGDPGPGDADDDGDNGVTGTDGGSDGSDGDEGGDGDGDGESEGDGDGDGDGDINCFLNCGEGDCVLVDEVQYCDCPAGSIWGPDSCEPCPVADGADQNIEIPILGFSGRFLVDGAVPPASEYDDANIWLENPRTGDRVHVGNTHDGEFDVRVTPGLYDVIYEVENAGNVMPENARARLFKLPVFEGEVHDIDIPVAARGGDIRINDEKPPNSEYDDGQIFFRDTDTGDEVLAGNTHDASYSIRIVAGSYDVIYRAEDPGQVVPHNDGARVGSVFAFGTEDIYDVEIVTQTLSGSYLIAGDPAPASEYQDGNIELHSQNEGVVAVGNTHEGDFSLNVIPGLYDVYYMHENGTDVPQNARARVGQLDLNEGGNQDLNVPMIQIQGALSLNGGAPPATEFDDAVLALRNQDGDEVPLGNTHDGAYTVNLVPGNYDIYYSQETAGGTVPENKGARIDTGVEIDAPASYDIDVVAVSLSGDFTINGGAPPNSQYEDGRVYLRDIQTGDSVLLGSTHTGSYSAVVLPGTYEAYYVEETGGDGVPANQDARLGQVVVVGGMSMDVEIPMTAIGGAVMVGGEPAPNTPSDGGQLYLRDGDGDSVFLGTSYGPGYGANLVTGTYGVFYRAGGSVTMPDNVNGQVGCFTIE